MGQETSGKRKPRKRIQEVVQFALSHPTRVDILIVLNEGAYPPNEIAAMIEKPLSVVSNHIRELHSAGAIEIAKSEPRRNFVIHHYRAVELPFVSQEEADAMTPEHFELLAGLVVQSALAEVIAALWSGKLADPRVILSWDWYNVDAQGRGDVEKLEKRFLEDLREVEVESTNRRAESGEDAESMLVTLLSYERARKGSDTRRTAREMVEGVDSGSHS